MCGHAQDSCTNRTPDVVERQNPEPAFTSSMAAALRDALLDAQAESELQRRTLFNPNPASPSVFGLLIGALKPGADHQRLITQALAQARELYESNERERSHVHRATGPLDQLATRLYVTGQRGPTIKDAASRLRDPLKVVKAEMSKGPGELRDWYAYFDASGHIKDVMREMPVEVLCSASMRRELRGLHDVLCELLVERVAEEAA